MKNDPEKMKVIVHGLPYELLNGPNEPSGPVLDGPNGLNQLRPSGPKRARTRVGEDDDGDG